MFVGCLTFPVDLFHVYFVNFLCAVLPWGSWPGCRSLCCRFVVAWPVRSVVSVLLHEGVGSAVGVALESGHPAVVNGAVDNRGGHVRVVEDPAPIRRT